MHGLMSYRHCGRARSLRSDRALARARLLCRDRAEHAFGCCVATLFELLSDDSRFLRKVFPKEESISKKYLSKKVFYVFFFGDLDVNFVVTVFDPNSSHTLQHIYNSTYWLRPRSPAHQQGPSMLTEAHRHIMLTAAYRQGPPLMVGTINYRSGGTQGSPLMVGTINFKSRGTQGPTQAPRSILRAGSPGLSTIKAGEYIQRHVSFVLSFRRAEHGSFVHKNTLTSGSVNCVEDCMGQDPGILRGRILARLRIRGMRRFNKTRRPKLRILMLDSTGLACAS
ncbi:hypothetical protein DY000_02052993 [Brassica cretica]|uniref:Uncharacterized protein n=1 Tax=Brassica cretica TaxID=69181 RepID=A0ABQ7AAJ5_BRACR|nr:hypothetical protein DY000_02052993 [Brassica cretica]